MNSFSSKHKLAMLLLAASVGLPVLLASCAMQERRPATKPPLPGELADSVFAFGVKGGHPEWAVLRDKREDSAPYNFGHKKHNDPEAWPRMQEALAAIKKGESGAGVETGRAIHVEEKGGKFAMSCTFCHEVQPDGAYMKPIEFEKHCVDCHKGTLGVVGAAGDKVKVDASAKRLVRPQQIPHGSSDRVAELVDKAIAQFVSDDPPQFPKADPAKPAGEGEAKPAEESGGGGRRRRGGGEEPKPEAKPDEAKPAEGGSEQPEGGGGGRRRGGGGGEAKPADSGPKAKLPSFADKAAMQAWMKERRVEILDKLKDSGNCGLCHVDIKPGPAEAPELFQVSTTPIPSVWLTKSHFSHTAHSMVSCVGCHEKATSSEKTADIMLPGVESCQKCHAPQSSTVQGGAPHNCVLCHTYHERLPSSVMGHKSIEQVLQGGSATGAGSSKPKEAASGDAKPEAAKPGASTPAPH